MLGFIDKLYQKKISSKGLGVFRFFFAFTLFLEVNRIYRYRELYSDPIPFIEVANTDLTISLLIWLVVIFFVMIGLFTRFMSIISYVFTYILLNHLSFFEYHMDYTYLAIGFLLMFLPLSKSYSIDNLLKAIKYSSNEIRFLPNEKTSVLYYYLVVFFGICVVYLDSLFFKFECDTWLNGLGMWLPASLPNITILNDQWLLNQEYLIRTFGYLTFAFEIVFPFTFFIKKLRPYLLIIGLGLHLGILLEFPIPFFAIGVIAIYLLLVPVSFWDYIGNKIKLKKPRRIINLNLSTPIFYKKVILIKYFDVFNLIKLNNHSLFKIENEKKSDRKNGTALLKLLFVGLLFLQLNSTFRFLFQDWYIASTSKYISVNSEKPYRFLKKINEEINTFSHKQFGITLHGVFVDSHFRNYNAYFTLAHNNELIPIYDESGMPDDYLLGGSWINYTYRVNRPNLLIKDANLESTKKGLVRYAAFYACKNNISLIDNEFSILMKRQEVSFKWKKDLLKDNLKKPWVKVGSIKWLNKKANVTIILNDNI